MSPVPVSVLLCALLLGGPPQADDNAPQPCPAATEPASHEENDEVPAPCASPSASPSAPRPADVRRAESSGASGPRTVAAPSPVDEPVVYYTAEAAHPAATAARAVGHTSTAILVLLCVAVPAMRLSVGWPRFPTPYLGRRRRGEDREGR
ncbi:hypothetical protein ACFWTE_13360 [Nocardiopsis sp. NPDC058631]|uniref:hypothetical protein n=1 Tax=Nocardiopsis sp. NPDC058631 TaxID=3346566 RepID=UPI003650AEDE